MAGAKENVESGSDSNSEEANGYIVATMQSLLTFLLVYDLVAMGLSYRQVDGVVYLSSQKIGIEARKILAPVMRDTASLYTHLSASVGLTFLSEAIQASWCYSVAADAVAQGHGVAYFSMRIRFVSVSAAPGEDLNLPLRVGDEFDPFPLKYCHAMVSPMEGLHTRDSMMELTVEKSDALDPCGHSKLIGVTSDCA